MRSCSFDHSRNVHLFSFFGLYTSVRFWEKMLESTCISLEVFLTLLMVIYSRNLIVAYVQRILSVYIFQCPLGFKFNLMQLSIVISSNWAVQMCLILLVYDVTFFSTLPWVLLGPLEKKRTKEGQAIHLYLCTSGYSLRLSHLCHSWSVRVLFSYLM